MYVVLRHSECTSQGAYRGGLHLVTETRLDHGQR